jgi:hypothetical protein
VTALLADWRDVDGRLCHFHEPPTDRKLSRVGMGNLQAEIVLPIGPIDADEGGKFIVESSFHDSSGTLR